MESIVLQQLSAQTQEAYGGRMVTDDTPTLTQTAENKVMELSHLLADNTIKWNLSGVLQQIDSKRQ